MLAEFDAFPTFRGGVTVAAADVNNDGRRDIIVGQQGSGGTSEVRAFDSISEAQLDNFFAFMADNGVNVG